MRDADIGTGRSDGRMPAPPPEDALFQRFLSEVTTRAAVSSPPTDTLSLADLDPELRREAMPLCERHRREVRALARSRAPVQGLRSARLALWARSGRVRGRIEARRRAERPEEVPALLGAALSPLHDAWGLFEEYEVTSLLYVRHAAFRADHACRYHYWRAWLGAFALEWSSGSALEQARDLRKRSEARVEERAEGLAGLFSEWLGEEGELRESTVGLGRATPTGERLPGLVARLVCQEVRWRVIEEALEKRALWHASQEASGSEILVKLRLGEIGRYDSDFAGEDRALRTLSVLGRIASLSDEGHRALTRRETPFPTTAIPA